MYKIELTVTTNCNHYLDIIGMHGNNSSDGNRFKHNKQCSVRSNTCW